MTEMADQARRFVSAVEVPVIADADNGYGGPLNVVRTVREYAAAGVAALHIEDQVVPKKCGHMEGKRVIPRTEMVEKVHAMVEGRGGHDVLLIARSDARAPEGLDSALERVGALPRRRRRPHLRRRPAGLVGGSRVRRGVPGRPEGHQLRRGRQDAVPGRRAARRDGLPTHVLVARPRCWRPRARSRRAWRRCATRRRRSRSRRSRSTRSTRSSGSPTPRRSRRASLRRLSSVLAAERPLTPCVRPARRGRPRSPQRRARARGPALRGRA